MLLSLAILHLDPVLPEVILSVPPRKVDITPRDKEINFADEIGVSISVPRNATTKKVEQIDIATSFLETCEVPDSTEPISPMYSLATANEVEFAKEASRGEITALC